MKYTTSHVLFPRRSFGVSLLGSVCFSLAFPITTASSQESEFNPAELYAPQLGEKEEARKSKSCAGTLDPRVFEGAALKVDNRGKPVRRSIPLQPGKNLARIAAWADEPTMGPEGRPLPLAGSWNIAEGGFGPNQTLAMMREGHSVLLSFVDPSSEAMRLHFAKEGQKESAQERMDQLFETYYRPGLEFAREHKLPIAFRGWNWADSPLNFQDRAAKSEGREVSLEETASLLRDGKRVTGRTTDPFGSTEVWETWGRFWLGNSLLKRIQEVYPDPPMVIFLNNNEAGEPHTYEPVSTSDRFLAKFGPGPHEPEFFNKVIREAYDEKYKAMFEAGKEMFVSPTWRKNFRTVSYNTLWGPTSIGIGTNPRPGANFDREKGWTHWRRYDGDMTEFYSNDWQGNKTEDRVYSMQAEAMNMASIQDWILQQRPDYLLTHIFWDGGVPGNVFRGRRAVSKSFAQIASGNRWSFDRYEGWAQFCLWATRPRLAFEFRSDEMQDAHNLGVWNALLTSVDRPWNDALLEEFWRKGTLVPNLLEAPAFNGVGDDQPEWIRNLDRWHLLPNNINPDRAGWDEETRLSVFILARVLGEAPSRRWLIYAHAPQVARENVRVLVPDFGLIELDSVPQSGSFFLLDEAERSLTTVLGGGPDQIRFTVGAPSRNTEKWKPAGVEIPFAAVIAHAPDRKFTDFVWDFGDGTTLKQSELAPVQHVFKEPGIYLVSLRASDDSGEVLSEQVPAYIGTAPDPAIIYDLALDQMLEWEGPWAGDGADGMTLVTYRYLPSATDRPQMGIATGTKLVEDPEKGTVMEFDGRHAGVWMARNKDTVMTGKQGASNRTVSFSFKAKEVAGRQVLYASGITPVGVNIYLDNDTLYAGSWASVDGVNPVIPPVFGYNWKGDWITYGPIEPNRWYEVTWVLKDGTNQVEPDRQFLYIDGKLVGKAPGAAIPAEYMPPRLGRTHDSYDPKITITRFHDQDEIDQKRAKDQPAINNFRGWMSGFRFINAAVKPGGSPSAEE